MTNPAEQQVTTSEPRKIRILIADDHPVVLEGLVAIISRQPDMVVVAEASDGKTAVELWQTHRPDVLVIDLRMPVLDGVAAIEEICKVDSAARLIVLTTFDTDTDLLKAVKAGAKAYLLKDARREEFLDTIRRVNQGETCISAQLVPKLAAGLSREALTSREVEVLENLARGKSNKEIGVALNISETTVKSHTRSIFRKLDVLSRTEAIGTANRLGLIKL